MKPSAAVGCPPVPLTKTSRYEIRVEILGQEPLG